MESEELLATEPPKHILDIYRLLWQLEQWLRRLVYVELKALRGDAWDSKIVNAERPREKDKRLSHMPIVEENLLSYTQLSELCRIITDDWRLFEHFLPPNSIWEAKLEEVAQIRHRVAHFRSVHHDDFDRVVRLLKDIDKGFWRFCTSYNDGHKLVESSDPVLNHFYHWRPYQQDRVAAYMQVVRRPWADWGTYESGRIAGKEGFIFNALIAPVIPSLGEGFQYSQLSGGWSRRLIYINTSFTFASMVTICFMSQSRQFLERVRSFGSWSE